MLARTLPLAAALCLAVPTALAEPVTYQGVLEDAGSPANGLYDIRFDLYDDATPGAPDTLIESETLFDVAVTDGRFTVDVPFGTFSFDNAARYLELSVRQDGAFYTTLLPRQQVTEAPLATYATRASSLDLPVSMGADSGAPGTALLTLNNIGPSGYAFQGTGPVAGIIGHAGDTTGAPVVALAPAGMQGRGEATGVSGSSGTGVGVIGASSMGTGGEFFITSTDNANPALLALTPSTQANAFAIHGILSATSAGTYAAAVRGESRATNGATTGIGVWGSHEGLGWGVYGTSVTGVGVRGTANSGVGLYGSSLDGNAIRGFSAGSGRAGFFEINETTNTEAVILARTDSTQSEAYGVHGMIESSSPGSYSAGLRGENRGTGGLGIGVHGSHNGSGWGVLGESSSGVGVYGSSNTGYAGYFGGDVTVTGTLAKGAGSFKIDHPLDPANQYLSHSFVESPEMMNVYSGMTTLNADGRAEVTLPYYFEALNENFRYQLTCIGGFAPVYIDRKISANSFAIAGGTSGLEVSWQVTGARRDAYARHNPIVVEQDKPDAERGRYLHPEAHGKPADLAIGSRAPQN
ncbi:MAG: hypothetical protein DHS20C14_20590 [Phycisphaeraceae bacterium]|nr:MAG: hypothetical protein DHS20C14_20590 [Phycisphaeraceae bacterium]